MSTGLHSEKPAVEYLHCFFYREGSFTDDSQFFMRAAPQSLRKKRGAALLAIQSSAGNFPAVLNALRESAVVCSRFLPNSRLLVPLPHHHLRAHTHTHTHKVVVVGCVEDIISVIAKFRSFLYVNFLVIHDIITA